MGFFSLLGGRRKTRTWAGLRVNAMRALITAVDAMTSANWRNSCPVMPGMNEAGRNTAISTRVTPTIGPVSSLIALIAASRGDIPCSM